MAGLTVKQRAAGAIIGSMVADAAALPLHWIYDQEEVKSILSKEENPEFLPINHCPYYKVAVGKNSCYGDQTFVLLQSIVESNGFNKENYAAAFYKKFGPSSEYEVNEGRPITDDDMPISGPWRNGCVKTFLKNYSEKNEITGDPDDIDADGTVKVVPVVAMYAGHPEMLKMVEKAVRVAQEGDLAVKWAVAGARLLEQFILHGHSPDVAIEALASTCEPAIKDMIDAVRKVKDIPHEEAVSTFGLSCELPGNFQNVLHCLLTVDPHNYVTAVRKTLIAGGDNCSRTMLVGACVGAMVGEKGIPHEWIDKMMSSSEVVSLAHKLADICK